MNRVLLYIKDTDGNFQSVDLFEDETISVTSKIQDIRDISKVFTDFSQSFTLPASKKNNKIFRHFYNYHISEGAFDARKKVDAVLEINYMPFRQGKVLLNGVKMKDNSPLAYNVTFFGDTVNLKDALGDDELSVLDLSAFDHDYDSDAVETGLTTGYFSDSIIYPLITHTKRLYFNSDHSHSSDTIIGDLSYNNGTVSEAVALTFDDLKPAIKVTDIIDAIEAKSSYGLTFASGSANNFFESTAVSNLYLWLSKTKGILGGDSGESTRVLGDWQHDATTDDVWDIDPSNEQNLSLNFQQYFPYPQASVKSTLTITPDSSPASNLDIEYDIEMLIDGTVVSTVSGVKGINALIHTETVADLLDIITPVVTFRVKSKQVLVFEPFLKTEVTGSGLNDRGDYTCPQQSIVSSIIVSDQMPKMKIIDFLTGLFSLFNLTAFIEQDRNDTNYGKIKVLTLDDFYDSLTIFDITKYIHSSETDIESTIPFSEIDFEYKEGKTLLMKQHKETFNDEFGNEEFMPSGVDRGKPYKVSVPFEHFKFERLIDENSSGIGKTQIQWGYSAGENFKPIENPKTGQPSANYEPVLTAPMLFYGIRITNITEDEGINFNGTTHDELLNYWKPSNTNETGTNDIDEYTENGTTTSTSSGKLVDSGKTFTTSITQNSDGNYDNYFVKNTDDTTLTKITAVDSDTTLSLADDIFVSGEDYIIYKAPEYTLNFDNEVDEWSFTDYGGQSNSLFKNFYKTYIEDAFNAKKRIFKLTANLPNSILLTYNLNDRFQIGDKVFTINSIDTNLKTGESKLELLNVL
jgi:hypothetical protein